MKSKPVGDGLDVSYHSQALIENQEFTVLPVFT